MCSPLLRSRSLVLHRKKFVSSSGTLIYVATTQGMTLDHLLLVAREANKPKSHRTIGEIVLGWLPSSGHCTGQQTETHPSLFVKETYLLVLELYSERQASSLAHIWPISKGLLRCTMEMEVGGRHHCTLSLPLSSSTIHQGKKLVTSGSTTFVFATRGHL